MDNGKKTKIKKIISKPWWCFDQQNEENKNQ